MTHTNQNQLGNTLWSIATCLSSLDALKTHKKGLMQQIFQSPQANEG